MFLGWWHGTPFLQHHLLRLYHLSTCTCTASSTQHVYMYTIMYYCTTGWVWTCKLHTCIHELFTYVYSTYTVHVIHVTCTCILQQKYIHVILPGADWSSSLQKKGEEQTMNTLTFVKHDRLTQPIVAVTSWYLHKLPAYRNTTRVHAHMYSPADM